MFVKCGVDDAADLMPLKGLYRSQVLRIAEAVGVPAEVLARTPNPEMLPGIEDKYLDIFGVPAPTVDLMLWGIEHHLRTWTSPTTPGLPRRRSPSEGSHASQCHTCVNLPDSPT